MSRPCRGLARLVLSSAMIAGIAVAPCAGQRSVAHARRGVDGLSFAPERGIRAAVEAGKVREVLAEWGEADVARFGELRNPFLLD